MTELRDTLSAGLLMWQALTGIDPNARSMTFGGWKLKETFDELQEAIELDPTQVTATLLLAHFVENYLADRSFSMLELVREPASVREQLAKPAALVELLDRPEVSGAREEYVCKVQKAIAHYGADSREDMQKLLSQPHELAVLRRDALRSMARLRVDQFLRGAPEPEHVKPAFNKVIFQFWNINSCLAAATRMPSGVSLNLIRHPDAFQSYFVIVIRNGSSLFVVSDVPEDAHPLQGGMRRRPDRDMARRANRNWFPYSLLDLEYDEENARLYVAETKRRDLVAYQHVALPLTPVSALEPEVLVWLTMMFDLIVERFWGQGYQAPQLSYTAEMLRANPLLDAAKSANLPALAAYAPVALEPLTHADVSAEASTVEEIGDKADQPNAWMEARYGSRVPSEAFNLLGSPEDRLLIGLDGAVEKLDVKAYESMPFWDQEKFMKNRATLNIMDATSFGSREKLQADRKFIARANFADGVERLAQEEFEQRKTEVLSWYAQRVRANLPTLLQWVGNSELWVDDGIRGAFSGYEGDVGRQVHKARGFITHVDADNPDGGLRYYGFVVPSARANGAWTCVVNNVRASHRVVFNPANAEELALLAGCSLEELPDVLQHWNRYRPYRGNCILNRIDPMVWRVKNPWLELDLRVCLPLSKRALAKLLKEPVVVPPLRGLCDDPGKTADKRGRFDPIADDDQAEGESSAEERGQ